MFKATLSAILFALIVCPVVAADEEGPQRDDARQRDDHGQRDGGEAELREALAKRTAWAKQRREELEATNLDAIADRLRQRMEAARRELEQARKENPEGNKAQDVAHVLAALEREAGELARAIQTRDRDRDQKSRGDHAREHRDAREHHAREHNERERHDPHHDQAHDPHGEHHEHGGHDHDHAGHHHPDAERLEHLKMAAEHLAAAGMDEMWREVHERAQRLERELHHRDPRHNNHHGGSEELLREVAERMMHMSEQLNRLEDKVHELERRR